MLHLHLTGSCQISPLLFSFIYISSANDFLWPPPVNPSRHLPFNFLNQHSTEILRLNFLTSLWISGLPITFMFQLLSIPIFTYMLFLSGLFAHFFSLFIPLYLCAHWLASFTSFLSSHPYQIPTGKCLLSVFNLCPPLNFLLFFRVLGLNPGTCACRQVFCCWATPLVSLEDAFLSIIFLQVCMCKSSFQTLGHNNSHIYLFCLSS